MVAIQLLAQWAGRFQVPDGWQEYREAQRAEELECRRNTGGRWLLVRESAGLDPAHWVQRKAVEGEDVLGEEEWG